MGQTEAVLPAGVTRGKSPDRVDITRLGSKVAKCRCSGDYRNVVSDRRVVGAGLRSVHELTLVADGEVDLAALKDAGVVNRNAVRAKVIASGRIDRPVTLRGVGTTAGARKAIEEAGGRVED